MGDGAHYDEGKRMMTGTRVPVRASQSEIQGAIDWLCWFHSTDIGPYGEDQTDAAVGILGEHCHRIVVDTVTRWRTQQEALVG